MKAFFFSFILLLYFNLTLAQQFDIADFNNKAETSKWLLDYDLAAWWSTDTLITKDKEKLKKLGREWFCFQDSASIWHAIYGKLENGKYDQVFHFIVKSKEDITESSEKIDSTFLNSHGRALSAAYARMKNVRDSSTLKFNHYIKKNDRENYDVYIFPGFQQDGTAVYGGEFIYEISGLGEIIVDHSYYQGQFKGFQTGKPREIWLNYRELDKPSLGSVFFAWYYKDYFTKIHIDNSTSFSTPFNDGKEYIWLNVLKDLKKEAMNRRKAERKAKKKKS